MKNLILLFILLACAACAPTVALKSVKEITHPDGTKTIEVTKALSQHISVMETKSTKEVRKKFE